MQPSHPLRFPALALLVCLLSNALVAHAASAAQFDLCVRGTSLDDTRTARLHLAVDGAEVAAFAARLGAELANHRFWGDTAEEVYGSDYDPEVCGDTVAPELKLGIELSPEDAAHLADAAASEDRSALRRAVAALPAAAAPGASAHKDFDADVGEPVRDAAGNLRYHVMRVYYATDRLGAHGKDTERAYDAGRGPLSLGVVNVTLPRTHERGTLESPSILRLEFSASPDKHVMIQSITELGAVRWRAEVAKRATALGNPGILLFVHGYNTGFADAALRAGQLAYDLKFAGATVLFSWPSRGSLLRYTADEEAAEWAIPDLQDVLASLATLAPGTPVYVIAHSMGTRVFTRAFKELLARDPGKGASFKQIVLAAPDIDAEVFRRELAPSILGRGPRVTLYASSNDRALAASRRIHGGYRRLGESGPDLVVLQKLDTIDASGVSTEMLGHSYYGDSRTVMSDLIYVIRKSLPPEQRERFALSRVQDALVGLHWRFKAP